MPVTLPTTVNTANTDSATDDPKQMRADLLDLMQKFNNLLGFVNSLGIMQPGDGVEQVVNGAGVKDSARVKLDGTSLTRSAAGIKINGQGVKGSMLDGSATDTPGNSKYYGTNGSGARGFYDLPVGILLQRRYTSNATASTATGYTAFPLFNSTTTPTTSMGVQVFSDSITLANAANKVAIEGAVQFTTTANRDVAVAVFRGSTCIYSAVHVVSGTGQISFDVEDAPGSTGPHTYSVRIGDTLGSTLYLNSSGGTSVYGGTPRSTMTLLEFA